MFEPCLEQNFNILFFSLGTIWVSEELGGKFYEFGHRQGELNLFLSLVTIDACCMNYVKPDECCLQCTVIMCMCC